MDIRTKMEITNDTPRLDGGELLHVLHCAAGLVGNLSPNGLPPYIEYAPSGDYRITDLSLAKDDLINATNVVKTIVCGVRNSLCTARKYMGYKSRKQLLDELRVEDTPDATYCELAAFRVGFSLLSLGTALRELAQWRGMQASPFIPIGD